MVSDPSNWPTAAVTSGFLRTEALVGDEVARGEIVGAVGDHIVGGDQVGSVVGGEPDRMGLDRDMGVDPADGFRRALDLETTDRLGVVDHLPLEIGERHGVVVDDAERAHAGRGKVLDHRRAKTAGADNQHPRALELLLAGTADIGEHDVPGVALDFLAGRDHSRT